MDSLTGRLPAAASSSARLSYRVSFDVILDICLRFAVNRSCLWQNKPQRRQILVLRFKSFHPRKIRTRPNTLPTAPQFDTPKNCCKISINTIPKADLIHSRVLRTVSSRDPLMKLTPFYIHISASRLVMIVLGENTRCKHIHYSRSRRARLLSSHLCPFGSSGKGEILEWGVGMLGANLRGILLELVLINSDIPRAEILRFLPVLRTSPLVYSNETPKAALH